MKYQNTSSETRRWTGIQRPDGRGLELEPGEVVELDCEVSDPFLAPVSPPRKGKKPDPAPEPAPDDTAAPADSTSDEAEPDRDAPKED
jgi:hypothetical protein